MTLNANMSAVANAGSNKYGQLRDDGNSIQGLQVQSDDDLPLNEPLMQKVRILQAISIVCSVGLLVLGFVLIMEWEMFAAIPIVFASLALAGSATRSLPLAWTGLTLNLFLWVTDLIDLTGTSLTGRWQMEWIASFCGVVHAAFMFAFLLLLTLLNVRERKVDQQFVCRGCRAPTAAELIMSADVDISRYNAKQLKTVRVLQCVSVAFTVATLIVTVSTVRLWWWEIVAFGVAFLMLALGGAVLRSIALCYCAFAMNVIFWLFFVLIVTDEWQWANHLWLVSAVTGVVNTAIYLAFILSLSKLTAEQQRKDKRFLCTATRNLIDNKCTRH